MEERKRDNIVLKMLEIKRAIKDCVQNGGELSDVEKKYGIRFVKPF